MAALDTTYVAGERVLALERSGTPPEVTFSFRWRDGTAAEQTYGNYTGEFKADLVLVAEGGDYIAGLLIVVVPTWTDAGEITDLVLDRRRRRAGAGRALVEAAATWARERGLRALWVEPRADNADAIEFYLRLGFRISGFNDRMYSNADDANGNPTIYMYLELT